MKTKDDVLAALKAAGLSAVAKDLLPLIGESLRLTTRPAEEHTLPPGSSKFGGLPDLPPGAKWPTWNNVPMSFVAQINLQETTPYDTAKLLPSSGLLSFFYDANQQDFGSEAVDPGQWHVFFSKPADLSRLPAPSGLPSQRLFKACAVTFSTELTLPLDSRAFGLQWAQQDLDRYSDFMSHFPDPADRKSTHHRMLGHTDQIQDDMHTQVAQETHSDKNGLDWLLLLQVDTDDNTGMNWANNGMLYYWIRQADLKAQNFDHIWLVLQSE